MTFISRSHPDHDDRDDRPAPDQPPGLSDVWDAEIAGRPAYRDEEGVIHLNADPPAAPPLATTLAALGDVYPLSEWVAIVQDDYERFAVQCDAAALLDLLDAAGALVGQLGHTEQRFGVRPPAWLRYVREFSAMLAAELEERGAL